MRMISSCTSVLFRFALRYSNLQPDHLPRYTSASLVPKAAAGLVIYHININMPIRCAAVFYRINHIIYDQLCPKRNTVHGNRLSLNRNGTACCDAIRKLTAADLACTVCCQLKFTQILYLFRMCFLCGSERIIKGSVLLRSDLFRCQSHIFGVLSPLRWHLPLYRSEAARFLQIHAHHQTPHSTIPDPDLQEYNKVRPAGSHQPRVRPVDFSSRTFSSFSFATALTRFTTVS